MLYLNKHILLSKKLHILFLSSWYPNDVKPFIGDFIERHAKAVSTQHKVTVVHVITDDSIKKKGYKISEDSNIKSILIYLPKTRNKVLNFVSFFRIYLREINKIGHFDLIHMNITFPIGIVALYYKWFKNKKYLISEHWSGYQFPHNKKIGFLQKKIAQLIVKNADYICPVSKNLQSAMEGFGLKGNYSTVPNVVDTSHFNISTKTLENFTITHISSMDNDVKNIEGILSVFSIVQSSIPNVKFQLIGENSGKYEPLVKELNIKNIELIDQIPNAEVATYLKKSNVFVLFSNYENLPCVILESFACGVPVISTDVGGIKEYFPNDFGILIEPKKEDSLKNAILKIYNSEVKSDKKIMHEYAHNNFGIEAISNSFSELYHKILSN